MLIMFQVTYIRNLKSLFLILLEHSVIGPVRR
jgi:hypothetical protein